MKTAAELLEKLDRESTVGRWKWEETFPGYTLHNGTDWILDGIKCESGDVNIAIRNVSDSQLITTTRNLLPEIVELLKIAEFIVQHDESDYADELGRVLKALNHKALNKKAREGGE